MPGKVQSLAWCGFMVWSLLVLWAYWPGQHGPGLLDDKSSLGVLQFLEDGSMPASDIIFGEKSGPTGRPIAMLSFVAERQLLDADLSTSKQINIFLHLLTGLLVWWFLSLLLQWSRSTRPALVAFVCAAVWIAHPLHVSTVLYAVQRMTILAAFFVLAALISYIYWRRSAAKGQFAVFPVLGFFTFSLLGFYSKENAAVVLPLVVVLELFWFQGADNLGRDMRWLRFAALFIAVTGLLGGLLGLAYFWGDIAARFGSRDYTLEERLLTQSRVLWDYLHQFIWADLGRLGLYHDDFRVSKSITQPTSTMFAVLGWLVVLLLFAMSLMSPWSKRLACGLLFFLAGHSVESSVLSLEIYFEHRNYLPTVGLVLVLAVVLSYAGWLARIVQPPLLVWFLVYAVVQLFSTSSQAQIWSSPPLLILTHLNGHPESARANLDMAMRFAALGELGAAFEFSQRAHRLKLEYDSAKDESPGDHAIRDVLITCAARQPLTNTVVERIGQADPSRPVGSVHGLHLLVRARQDQQCPELGWMRLSDRLADLYLREGAGGTASGNMYAVLAGLENANGEFNRAYKYAAKYLHAVPKSTRGQLMQLHFTTALGKVEEAEALKQALLEKQAQGELTVGEQQNLALYLE